MGWNERSSQTRCEFSDVLRIYPKYVFRLPPSRHPADGSKGNGRKVAVRSQKAGGKVNGRSPMLRS